MHPQLYINVATSAAHIALVAVGFAIVYQIGRCFHFAHAAVYTVGAYAAFTASNHIAMSPWFSLCVGVGAGALLGGIIELCVYMHLRRTRANSLIFMLASLGILVVVQNAISAICGDETRSLPSAAGFARSCDLWGGRVTGAQLALILLCIFMMVVWAVVQAKTKLGVAIRAVSNDEDLSRVMGVKVTFTVLAAVLFGSALAGSAGVLWGYNSAIHPRMGFTALLLGIVAALVGGVESVRGVLLGSILLACVQQVAMWKFPTQWQDVPVFILLILFLLFRPQGVLGKSVRSVSV